MARGATLYRAQLSLSHLDEDVYLEQSLRPALHPSELPERLVARLLAWCWHARPGLTFTRGLSTREEPDLWEKDEQDMPQLWLEIGEPDPARIRKALSLAGQVTVFSYGPRRQWWQRHGESLKALPRTRYLCIDGPLEDLARALPRQFAWQITVLQGVLYLTDHNDRNLDFHVENLT
jgi:uncharacterized protein YaeQ